MAFFSYERILRGVLSWRKAAVFSTILSALCTALLVHETHLGTLPLSTSISIFVLVPLALAALVDSVCHILPDPLLAGAALIAVIALCFSPWVRVKDAIVSAAIFLVIGLFMSRISSFGQGDAKLMGVLGLWLANPIAVCASLLFAFAGAALFALVLLAIKRAKLTSSIALGPWLVFGAFLSYVPIFTGMSV